MLQSIIAKPITCPMVKAVPLLVMFSQISFILPFAVDNRFYILTIIFYIRKQKLYIAKTDFFIVFFDIYFSHERKKIFIDLSHMP